MKRLPGWSLAVLVGLAMWSSGCMGRLVGEGAEKALGPKGDYWEEQPLAASKKLKVLDAYGRFELGAVQNDYGRNLPSDFIPKFKAEFAKQLKESRLAKAPPGKTLVFNVSLVHYEVADTTDNVLGPLEQVVARVTLVDKDTQQVLATGNAIGRTGKTVGLGVDWKARGLAKALLKWAMDYYPKGEEDDDEPRKK